MTPDLLIFQEALVLMNGSFTYKEDLQEVVGI